ncbi:MAG: hypothetical protein DI607_09290 [Sphingomonas hengshuiensis]|uniref:helix-turn-helix transcriptional regulator n=1 Tax=Nevskia sp. TaxID=1929292 RepID=UPI000DB538E5|nr:helix-turn-helix transcriptional regulator [Nevskia sp.]PZP12646.1 MAG: hypothetical protein DI607_09290 [Sphingomonas hengshuiensis]
MTATRILGQVLARQQVADVGISRCVPSVPAHDIVEHRHVEAHFIVVERGRYDSLADGAADADLREPLLLFNPPGTEHHDCFAETQVLEEARFSAITIGFAHWQRLSRDLRLPGWPVARQGAASQRSLQRLLQVLHRPEPSAIDADSLVAELAGSFAADIERTLDRAPAWLRRCQDALRDDPAFALEADGLNRLARSFDLHPVYLARAFRAVSGCSPGDYARRHRLERAAAAVASTSRGIVDIAADAGFHDQSHFTRSFRAAYGIAPAAYRALVK